VFVRFKRTHTHTHTHTHTVHSPWQIRSRSSLSFSFPGRIPLNIVGDPHKKKTNSAVRQYDVTRL